VKIIPKATSVVYCAVMAYDFSRFKSRTGEIAGWLKIEYAGIHTGRATPVILDKIFVESYGSKMPVHHVASISTDDARTLRVIPWDKGQIKDIEQAIRHGDLGVGVSSDDQGVRVSFPELTAENREMLLKIVKRKLEEARISVKKEREETWEDIQAKEKGGALSEDEKFRAKDELQKLTDEANTALEDLSCIKEKDIKS